MKKFIFIPILFSLFLFSCEKPKTGNLHIEGKFSNCSGDTLYLVDISHREMTVIDSCVADENGSFNFITTIQYEGFFNIDVGKNSQQFATIIAGPGDSVTLSGDAKNLGYTWQAKGSHETERFMVLNTYITSLEKARHPLQATSDSLLQDFQFQVSVLKDSTQLPVLDKKYGDLVTEIQNKIDDIEMKGAERIKTFIDEDSSSFANIPALQLLDPYENFPYYLKTIDNLEKKYKDAPNVKLLRDYVESIRPHCKGQVAADIALNDPNGKAYKLSSLKGKIVLLDFWASWCGPCKEELPNVVKNYKLYHDKGFEVFSVSLDDNKKEWQDAIAKFGLVWPYHVSDLMRWQSSVVPLYELKGIP
ncbi:MAG TPA: TlpA disulfide reductase family protein, partial [Bacteroidia bacterium]|nr:TlpA disulfide reductase family protein [Bacteroidia bacterium]